MLAELAVAWITQQPWYNTRRRENDVVATIDSLTSVDNVDTGTDKCTVIEQPPIVTTATATEPHITTTTESAKRGRQIHIRKINPGNRIPRKSQAIQSIAWKTSQKINVPWGISMMRMANRLFGLVLGFMWLSLLMMMLCLWLLMVRLFLLWGILGYILDGKPNCGVF